MESCKDMPKDSTSFTKTTLGHNIKEGDAEVAPMDNPEDYQYDIDCAEVAELCRGSVVGSWLFDLTADVLRRDREP